MLQFLGENLQEQSIKLKLPHEFLYPEDEIKKLKTVAKKGTPLRFIKGNGEYVGVFVISEISSVTEQASKEGYINSIQLDLKLREYTGKVTTTTRKVQRELKSNDRILQLHHQGQRQMGFNFLQILQRFNTLRNDYHSKPRC